MPDSEADSLTVRLDLSSKAKPGSTVQSISGNGSPVTLETGCLKPASDHDHSSTSDNWSVLSDSDSDYVESSDSEKYTDVMGIDCLQEKDKERDVTTPQIYIRKCRKSQCCSPAQKNRKKVENTRVYDNYHACLYCGKLRLHIKSHLITHKALPAVKKLLEADQPDFARIRKLGDHKHNVKVLKNGEGEIILTRRPSFLDVSLFGPCPECSEWILLKNMKVHYKKCAKPKRKISEGNLIIQSQVFAGVIGTNPSPLMLQEVFPSMRQDEIGNIAKNDALIVVSGESWLRKSIDNIEKRRYYTSQHMRLIARVLIELRKEDAVGSNKSLTDYLCTQTFDNILSASLKCCLPYMDDVEDLQSPSNTVKLKYDILRVVNAKWALLVKQDPHSKEAKEMETFLDLITLEWEERLTKLAQALLVRQRFSLKKELPTPENVMKLTNHTVEELKRIDLVPENLARIVQLAQTRLLLYNKRSSGEVDVISVENFAGRTKDVDKLDQSMMGELTKVERHLFKTQEMMTVRGKGHRPVPILIPADVQGALGYLASQSARKEANITLGNHYLFPSKGTVQYTRSYDSLKQTCQEINLAAPGRISSITMRKYTATLSQVFNLDSYQIKRLCPHLEHTPNIHNDSHMSDFVERVKLSKLFLMQDLNLTSQYKGKNIDDINLQDLIFPNTDEPEADAKTHTIQDEDDTNTNDIDEVVFETAPDSDSETELKDMSDEDGEEAGEKRICKRQRWDKEELEELERYFQRYIQSKTCPRKKAIESAKKKSMKCNGKLWERSNDKIVKKISNINHKI